MKVIKSLENRGILFKSNQYKNYWSDGGFLNFRRLSMAAGLPLMKNVLTPLAKHVLISFGLIAAVSATDAAIQKKNFGSGTTTLIISNKEMKDIMKIVKSLEESGLLIESISETITNEVKEEKSAFIPMLLGILAASLLPSELIGRGVIRAGKGTIIRFNNVGILLHWIYWFHVKR